MKYGTKDGMTWHVVKDSFPVTETAERAVLWLCGEVESGSEILGRLVISDALPAEEGTTAQICDLCKVAVQEGVLT